mmetsp:Transcript_20539/g.19524  ORF Transcript_20539/g.19524 Transcript_20539/m.19524 type:complete len:205 (-) Transcript_20539:49-663(-)
MLYKACSDEVVECDFPDLPWISNITCLPFYDRIFCIVTMIFSWGVFQVDCRAFYHKLQGIATQKQNDLLLLFGFFAAITMPLIGYFDENAYPDLHVKIATSYFAFGGLYALLLSRIMDKNRSAFPEEKHAKIDKMVTINRIYWITLIMQAFGNVFPSWIRHLAEWTSALLLINYFALISDFDNYYDTVISLPSNLMTRAFAAKA